MTKPIYPDCECASRCESCVEWTNAENPKDAQARQLGKIPLDLLEPAANREIAKVMKHGADKYGRRNFLQVPIQLRVYVAATMRHVQAVLDGEDIDPDSGLSHWAHVGACANVVLAALDAGTFVDDRETLESA